MLDRCGISVLGLPVAAGLGMLVGAVGCLLGMVLWQCWF